ncbi:MAG TPA: PAS domain-containing sensor histidine kinase [Bacteroidia bacterium]
MNEELITLEQKLSLLTINSEESFVLVDTNYNIVAFNRQFKNQYIKYFGTTFKKGDSIFSLVQKNRVEQVKKIYERVFAGKTEYSEIVIPLPDKNELIISNKFKPAFNEDGSIVGAFVTSFDITDIRKAQIEKTKSENKIEFDSKNLKALINNTKDLIWSIDLNHKILTFNDAFSNQVFKIYNKYPTEGEDLTEYFSHENKNRMMLYINRAISGESFSVIEHKLEPKETWSEVSFNPIVDDNRVLGVAFTSRDVTDRKLFERSLIQSQNRLKQAQEIAHIGHWEWNMQTSETFWSDEAYNIYGIHPEFFDHSFESWIKYVHPEDLEHVQALIKIGLETLENYELYHRIIRPDGTVRYIHASNHFEFDLDGKPKVLYGTIQDITERKSNEMKLQELLRNSNSENRMLNSFNHMVSHNLRSNSNNIKGIVDMIRYSDDEFERNELLEMLTQSSNKLNETVQNLSEYLTFQNKEAYDYKELTLKHEIDKTCNALNNQISELEVKIDNQIDENLVVSVVPSYLESILLNLLSNAIKYRSTDRNLVVEFIGEKKGRVTVLKVKDNGSGIDLEKNRKSIFGMFSTFHGNRDAIGFGLFMTKNQLESMGGHIEVESTINQGTTFILHFNEKS